VFPVVATDTKIKQTCLQMPHWRCYMSWAIKWTDLSLPAEWVLFPVFCLRVMLANGSDSSGSESRHTKAGNNSKNFQWTSDRRQIPLVWIWNGFPSCKLLWETPKSMPSDTFALHHSCFTVT